MIRWMFVAALVSVVVLASSVDALRCYTCDGLCNCRYPTLNECHSHPNTQCYTVKRLSDGKVTRKGCTSDCSMVNDFDGMCTLCRGANCNTETSLTPMSGAYDDCDNAPMGQGLGQAQVQGGGLGQQSFNEGIGAQGVGGIGQGVGAQEVGGIGQGVGGLGQGVGGLGQGVGGLGQGVGGLGQGVGGLGAQIEPSGLGQGLGQPGVGQGFGQPGFGPYNQQKGEEFKQHVGPGPQNGGIGQRLQYQPAPQVGSVGQGFDRQNPNHLGQGVDPQNPNHLGQGFENHIGQGFRNFAGRTTFNLAVAGAALFGLNRL